MTTPQRLTAVNMPLRKLARLVFLAVFAVGPLPLVAGPAGFVYVLDPATGCNTCAGPQVLVFDGATTRIVTRIPLERGRIPNGIAISPDGAHLYVSMGGVPARMLVIDARRHAVKAPYSPSPSGQIAVHQDDSAVYIRAGTELHRFDTATHTITASAVVGNGAGVSFNRSTGTVLVPVYGTGATGLVAEYDPVTLAAMRTAPIATGSLALSPSRTGALVHVLRARPAAGEPVALTTVDALTFGIVRDRVLAPSGGLGAPADAPSRGTVYTGGGAVYEVPDGSAGFTTIPLPVTTRATAITIPPGEKYAFITAARFDATGLTAVAAIDLDSRTIVSTYPLDSPPGVDLITSTPDGAPSCTYRLGSAYASFREAAPAAVQIQLSTTCAWVATADASWVHSSTTSGASGTTIQLSADSNTTGATRRATVSIGGQIVTVTQAGTSSQPGFGVIDTPADFATGISGALNITGWAMDDVGVAAVKLYRDPVAGEPQTLIPLGTATLVEGARPDVQAIFSGFPFASRGGWGYQLLTNMLPGGDGTYRLRVFVEDLEGHVTAIGSRTIAVANSIAALPFGAIDTPGQGDSVSGVITNWGWALTPQTASIATDGSTIDVVIDGVVVGHPTFGLNRPDIAALFPGYANTNSAVGYFTIDTTTLTNGVHTIAWVVRDNIGRAQGIGSRYFTVENGLASLIWPDAPTASRSAEPLRRMPVLNADIRSREGIDETVEKGK